MTSLLWHFNKSIVSYSNNQSRATCLALSDCRAIRLLKIKLLLPGAAMLLADLAQQAGLPPGVLNIVHGAQDVVNMICDDKDVRAISFVGSDRVWPSERLP